MSPFAQLGLSADADELSIKRAYAQRLRVTRPEDDPEGFQRLHAAYQAALEQCRRRAASKKAARQPEERPIDSVAPAEPAVAPAAVDSSVVTLKIEPAATAPALSVETFCGELVARASAGNAAELEHWLATHPALWSMPFKTACGRVLLQRLHRQPVAMPAACIATLIRFFDLDHARPAHDPFAMQHVWRRIQLAWECQPEHRAQLAERLDKRSKAEQRELDRTLRQLTRPFRWPQVLFSGIDVSKPGRIARTIRQMTGNDLAALPPTIQATQLQFWLAAADRSRTSMPRVVLGVMRCLAGVAAAVLIGVLLGLLNGGADGFSTEPVVVLFFAALIASAVWAAFMAWLPLNDWHSRREELPVHRPWLCLGLVPSLCACVVGLEWLGWLTTSLLLAVATAWLMLCRYARRNNGRILGLNTRVAWVLAVILSQGVRAMKDTGYGVGSINDVPAFIALGTLVLWSVDIWRNRRQLRVGGRRAAARVSVTR